MKTIYVPFQSHTLFLQDAVGDPLSADEIYVAKMTRNDNLFINWDVLKKCHRQHIYPEPTLKCRIQYNVETGLYQVFNKFFGGMVGGMEGENALWETPREVADWLLDRYFYFERPEVPSPVTKLLSWHHSLTA